jgi:hypothetical protein
MQIERIVTLANRNMRLRFLAMERSLRAVGCNLPLWVIPYDDSRFELPKGAEWWELGEVLGWLKSWNATTMMRRYQCFTISHYQYADTDIIYLRNPEKVLEEVDGFVTSCGHWHNPGETLISESEEFFKERSTTWQKSVFNAGQWACDRQLFDFKGLKERAEDPTFRLACLTFPLADQAGVNMLVNSTGITVRNLTLPPFNMQSTWAGDYSGDYRSYWHSEQETPYLIHWTGIPMDVPRPINELIYQYLSQAERLEWDDYVKKSARIREKRERSLRYRLRRLRRASKAFWRELSH